MSNIHIRTTNLAFNTYVFIEQFKNKNNKSFIKIIKKQILNIIKNNKDNIEIIEYLEKNYQNILNLNLNHDKFHEKYIAILEKISTIKKTQEQIKMFEILKHLKTLFIYNDEEKIDNILSLTETKTTNKISCGLNFISMYNFIEPDIQDDILNLIKKSDVSKLETINIIINNKLLIKDKIISKYITKLILKAINNNNKEENIEYLNILIKKIYSIDFNKDKINIDIIKRLLEIFNSYKKEDLKLLIELVNKDDFIKHSDNILQNRIIDFVLTIDKYDEERRKIYIKIICFILNNGNIEVNNYLLEKIKYIKSNSSLNLLLKVLPILKECTSLNETKKIIDNIELNKNKKLIIPIDKI